MKATQKLQELGQSLWLDNITRGLLISGTLDRYIKELSVTGLTSNPTIFDHAIKNSHDYVKALLDGLLRRSHFKHPDVHHRAAVLCSAPRLSMTLRRCACTTSWGRFSLS